MRIGIDYRPVTAAPQSGIARQVLALEQALMSAKRGPLIRFTAAPDGHPHRTEACCPAQAMPSDGLHRPRNRLAFEFRFLPKALASEDVGLYIATANSGLPWPRPASVQQQVLLLHDLFQLTLPGRHASWLRGAVYGMLDRTLIGHAVRSADRIWTPSAYSSAEAARLFPAQAHKLRVLPNSVAALPAADETLLRSLPQRFWLLVGTREPRKNVALLLEQWRMLRAQGIALPDLVLVGSVQDVAVELAALPGLHWRAGITDAQLAGLYHGAERLLHPAYAEGFGLPVIEALACGTPVAAATGSALDEILPAQALRFDPHDPASIQSALRLAAQGRRPEETPQVLRQAAARFNSDAYAANVIALLDELGP